MTTTTVRSRRGSLAKVEARQALGFASPALVGLALFTIVPVGLSVVMSFFDWPTFGERATSRSRSLLAVSVPSPADPNPRTLLNPNSAASTKSSSRCRSSASCGTGCKADRSLAIIAVDGFRRPDS